jgi:hypothetical protein
MRQRTLAVSVLVTIVALAACLVSAPSVARTPADHPAAFDDGVSRATRVGAALTASPLLPAARSAPV